VICLLDTDITSLIRKGTQPLVNQRAHAYLNQHGSFTISLITRYEILRGLKATNAAVQLASFETRCSYHKILPITDDLIVIASNIWADLKQTGQPIGDIDPIIAATALHHGLSLATGNVAHFSRIPGLTVEDWTQP